MIRFFFVIFWNLFRAPCMIPLMRKMAKHPERYTEEDRYALARRAIRYMKDAGHIVTEVYGTENLPREGGYVMYPNHQGKYDALGIIFGHDRPCSFVMDKAKSYTFLVKELVELLGAKRLDIHNVRQGFKVMNELTAELKQGKRFILFSEGGYQKNRNHVQEFKPGSFKCAVNAHVPIVPVVLIDSYKPFNSHVIGRIVTKVIFLRPLEYDEYKGMKTVEIARTVRNRIIESMVDFGVKDAV